MTIKADFDSFDLKTASAWLSPGEARLQTPRPGFHQQKVLLGGWWNSSGIVHYELLQPGTSITGEVYAAQLQRVQNVLIRKDPALVNCKGIVLLQDNARPHIARVVIYKLESLDWELLPHPPYSPDMSPCEYHLFLSLDNHMRNKRLHNKEQLEQELNRFFASKPKEFYAKGITNLVTPWEKIVETEGNYFPD